MDEKNVLHKNGLAWSQYVKWAHLVTMYIACKYY